MKKFIIALILFSTAISSSITAKVFLRNKYGADVYYAKSKDVKTGHPMNVLHDGEQVELTNRDIYSKVHPEVLELAKFGKPYNDYRLSLAVSYSFAQDVSDKIVAYINNMQKDESKHPNENIILTITPSWTPMVWSITPSWEPAK